MWTVTNARHQRSQNAPKVPNKRKFGWNLQNSQTGGAVRPFLPHPVR